MGKPLDMGHCEFFLGSHSVVIQSVEYMQCVGASYVVIVLNYIDYQLKIIT